MKHWLIYKEIGQFQLNDPHEMIFKGIIKDSIELKPITLYEMKFEKIIHHHDQFHYC